MSLRRLLSILALILASVGLLLAEATGWTFRELALDNQRAYVAELLVVESRPALQELTEVTEEMINDLHKEPRFDEALMGGEVEWLGRLMDEQFHQYYVTAGVVRLGRMAVLGRNMEPVVVSREGMVGPGRVCPRTLDRLAKRQGADRIRTATGLCFVDGRPWWVVVRSVGGLSPRGYVEALVDPVPVLLSLSNTLRLPVAVRYGAEGLRHSPGWPLSMSDRWLMARHEVTGEGGTLEIWAAKDVSHLLQRLDQVSWAVRALGGVIILFFIWGFWHLLRRVALDPLDHLGQALSRLVTDRGMLGIRVEPRGVQEVRALTQSFNQTSEELQNLYETLERMAYTDALTRLPNRSRFNEMLEFYVMLNRHRHAPFAVFLMDLDRFKWVNDNLGHMAGDMLLAEVGQRLASVLRKSDVLTRLEHEEHAVARLGGDEFAALVPGVRTEEEAGVVARKLASVLEQPVTVEGRPVQVGISIGVALSPQHGKQAGQLMRLADVAMYQAKQGGHVYQVYDETKDRLRRHRDTLEGALREAVMTGKGLSLVYQPQVNVCSRNVVGVEALARWRGPDGQMVSPDEFIPLAEECGLMERFTRWVLEQALDQLCLWYGQGLALRVSVNLSAQNLLEANFADGVRQALDARGLSGEWLCLEITETQLVAEPDQALVQLDRLGQMGVHLSLDDFGTGYSSLSYLRRMPLQEIKIDRSFVSGICDSAEDRVIVEAVVGLARGLGMEVLAEGVENLMVQEALRGMGCRLVQGYFISPPLTAAALPDWVEAWRGRLEGRANS